ncbi:MAG: hypothetical protein FWD62_08170 [Betaproteobacteria bacterium]|nr:hypothetical protein [Betaproteobacteria bacterium]
MPLRPSILFLAVLCCAGCDQLGFDSPKKIASEGNAIGAACRHAGRALEDCYQLNPQASKSAIFAGWKEMNDYMTEQKIDVVRPVLPPVLPKSLRPKKPAASESGDAGNSEATPENAAASAP